MASTCVVGLQWGDEAKGKIVDLLCDEHDAVVRYQGGANAGHTVVVGGVKYKLSLVPTGIVRPGVTCVIGNGVVIHPPALLSEIETLKGQGLDLKDRLLISDRAHLIMPYHLIEERLTEESASSAEHLGTTRRGIGPCYSDKVGRVHGLRVGDLFDKAAFHEHLTRIVAYKNQYLSELLPAYEPLDADAVEYEYLGYADRIAPWVTDSTSWLNDALDSGKRLLFEGAQGTLLDIDHGSYPYVTSSNSSSAGIAPGSGVAARRIERWIGVLKAYTTRVGGGPFPTEQINAVGERIRKVGNEYGTVTGRPRRCGWLDAVAARHAARVSGSTEIAVMLLDVLSGLGEIQVAVAYEDETGEKFTRFPSLLSAWSRCRPVYKTLKGWDEDVSHIRKKAGLPKEARAYIDLVGELVGVPVSIVSVGPERDQTIIL